MILLFNKEHFKDKFNFLYSTVVIVEVCATMFISWDLIASSILMSTESCQLCSSNIVSCPCCWYCIFHSFWDTILFLIPFQVCEWEFNVRRIIPLGTSQREFAQYKMEMIYVDHAIPYWTQQYIGKTLIISSLTCW